MMSPLPRSPHHPAGRQRGVALITALVVVVICSMIASDMLWSTFLDQRRTESVLMGSQAREYARGAEDWVAHLLRMQREETEYDHPSQQWAEEITALPLDEHGQLSGRLEDQQGLFNLNNLVDETGQIHQPSFRQFERLLISLELNPDIAAAVTDWIDPDQEPTMPGGAEDSHYLGLDPPYRTADQPIQSLSELRMIEGLQEDQVDVLRPYVTALPTMEETHININTAPPLVIASMSDNLTPMEAQTMAGAERQQGYSDVQEFLNIAPNIDVAVDVHTNFFKLQGEITVGGTSVSMYSLLARDESGATMTLRRTYGTR